MYIYNVCMRIINKNSRVVRIKVRLEKSTLDGRTTREVRVLRTDMRFAKIITEEQITIQYGLHRSRDPIHAEQPCFRLKNKRNTTVNHATKRIPESRRSIRSRSVYLRYENPVRPRLAPNSAQSVLRIVPGCSGGRPECSKNPRRRSTPSALRSLDFQTSTRPIDWPVKS